MAPRGRAFTLVEVLISIAIALLLIVGISQIFGMAQRTTGAGATVLTAIHSNQAVQGVLNQDFRDMVDDPNSSPGLIIASYSVPAFRNQEDAQNNVAGNQPTMYNNPTGGSAPLGPLPPYSVNYRIHRVDRICFFGRDVYHRQTADAPNLVSSTTSTEAFIWIGHLALPNNAAIANWDPNAPGGSSSGGPGGWFNPGGAQSSNSNNTQNDNNQYASSWILGRQVILTPSIISGTETGFSGTNGNCLSLFTATTNGAIKLSSSRYDLAYTDINAYYNAIANFYSKSGSPFWWENLDGLQTGFGSVTDQRYFANPYPTKPGPDNAAAYANYINNPATWISAAAAQTAPIFVRGCSQFIVEFAGDFVAQNSDGSVDNNRATDGQIDFIVDPVTGQRRIRWYGFPRDTVGNQGTNNSTSFSPDGQIDLTTPSGSGKELPDVMPLGMYYQNAGATAAANAFDNPNTSAPVVERQPILMNVPSQFISGTQGTVSPPYVCAWGPDTPNMPWPKLIRITIAVDDPDGRLNSEQTYEYVFALP